MLDDGKVKNFATQGCWVTCHNGMRDTPGQAAKAQVQSHPVLGKSGLRKSDILKYLASTRTDKMASWDKTRSKEEIARIKAGGGFLDLMQWRVARSNPVGMSDDGYVLEYRLFDKGKNPFSWNLDRKTMIPKYMFDAAKVGFKALRAGDIGYLDTPEKYEANRLELAGSVWADMKAHDSRECRNCHKFEFMDYTYQESRAARRHEEGFDAGQTCIDCHKGVAHRLPEGALEGQEQLQTN